MDKEAIFGTEEAIAKLITELVRTEDGKAKLMSDLNDEEVAILALLDTVGERVDLKTLSKFCTNFCQYRVSRFRLGRRELVNIASFTNDMGGDRKKSRTIQKDRR